MNNDLIKVSDHIEECIQHLSSENLNPAKLFNLTIQTIEFLDKEYSTFTGEQKKKLLIEAFNDLCDEAKHESLTIEIRMSLKNFINEDLETVIDSVIQLSKGNFEINKKQQKMLLRCLMKLCQCVIHKHNEEIKRP
tara:strand:+ start:531 stop:938 length:408 start_codon:yes stop_codon:yes gene_type:complete